MPDDIFFTTIRNPKDFRKHLLTSSKEAIVVLKEYQEILKIREAKKEKIDDLNQQFDELMGLMHELDNFLPEESLEKLREMMPEEEEPEEEPGEEESGDEGEGELEEEKVEEQDEDEEEPDESEGEPEDEGENEPEEPEEMTEEEKNVARLEKALSNIESKLNEL